MKREHLALLVGAMVRAAESLPEAWAQRAAVESAQAIELLGDVVPEAIIRMYVVDGLARPGPAQAWETFRAPDNEAIERDVQAMARAWIRGTAIVEAVCASQETATASAAHDAATTRLDQALAVLVEAGFQRCNVTGEAAGTQLGCGDCDPCIHYAGWWLKPLDQLIAGRLP